MSRYRIEFDKQALKYLQKQPRKHQERLLKAIYHLPEGDVRQLKGYSHRFRLRVGDYRVIFDMEENKMIILVLVVGSRGDIYK